jgi:hypothetical protein
LGTRGVFRPWKRDHHTRDVSDHAIRETPRHRSHQAEQQAGGEKEQCREGGRQIRK